MPIFIRPAGAYKLGRRVWVKIAGTWRRVVYTYFRKAGANVINSNYHPGLELNAFAQNSDQGELIGATTYSMSSPQSTEFIGSQGQSCLVLKGAFFTTVVATMGSNQTRILTCRAWVSGADAFTIPSGISVSVFDYQGVSLGSIYLPLVSNDGANLRYEVTGSGAQALVNAIRADTFLEPAAFYRRVAIYF